MLLGNVLSNISFDEGDYFDNANILIVEHNEKGAIGMIFNKKFNRKLNDLAEFRKWPNMDLFEGGPVQQDKLYFLHRMPEKIVGGAKVLNEIYWGGNLKKALELINKGKYSYHDIKIFVGYCGWDKGQLEDELARMEWLVVDRTNEEIFG